MGTDSISTQRLSYLPELMHSTYSNRCPHSDEKIDRDAESQFSLAKFSKIFVTKKKKKKKRKTLASREREKTLLSAY